MTLGVNMMPLETTYHHSACCLHTTCCLRYCYTLKIEAEHSSEMLVNFQQTTRCHIAEDSFLRSRICKNLIANKKLLFCKLQTDLTRETFI
jgi:hypothetical protein